GAPGMAVTLIPRRPDAKLWTRALELGGSAPALNAGTHEGSTPAIARLDTWAHGNLFLSGPLSRDAPEKLGAVFSATWSRSSYVERDRTATEQASLGSAFLNVTGRSGRDNDVRLIAWGQRTRDAAPNYAVFNQPDAGQVQTALHTQLSWQRPYAAGDGGVRLFASYTIGRRDSDLVAPASVVLERL